MHVRERKIDPVRGLKIYRLFLCGKDYLKITLFASNGVDAIDIWVFTTKRSEVVCGHFVHNCAQMWRDKMSQSHNVSANCFRGHTRDNGGFQTWTPERDLLSSSASQGAERSTKKDSYGESRTEGVATPPK
ncbi:hypothetical protein COU13_01225 [Candidatus Kaiserbacteria bacterium CG10_big_fil_rev_8_21_14_0_10_43_70]|uniref:Uncharacterized protein n=1 Tax=Candidatus Kaiserbacteria bacterium CG10_big_fil_rev_8_21_14_0_10_43_70 TaxID=1974605 RepID=A0A2H0UJ24_9BACT|nr:MAG: hypothetical protein COU13_01225 [Candidatus Kaiserbacteria bacterium CG10_big_fil_rev_8_21_14_0_10_43_70]